MSKTKEQPLPNVGDLLPYTNTHGKICIGEVTALSTVSSGKSWWDGIDKKTGATVFYPVKTSMCFKAYADQEKRSTAIAFAKWIAGQDGDQKLTLVDNQWYWETDTDGDQPLTEEKLFTFYINSL